MRPRGTAARIALASLAVAGVAIAVITVGVLVVGRSSLSGEMMKHGIGEADAGSMFGRTVTAALVGALLAAVASSILLSVLLARWVSRPLERIGLAARRIAAGDYHARVSRRGPEEVTALADSFNQMAESLGEQERVRSEFIANAAHELGTPLTNLQGYLEALRDGVIEPSPGIFASLHEESDRLVRLARSLTVLAESEGAPFATGLRDVDLSNAIASSVALAKPALERAGIEIVVDLPRRLAAFANPDHLAQVLANLLQNAIRYTPRGGLVTVGAEAGASHTALVHVSNTGSGIPAADLPHVFERFYRVEKSRDRSRGGAGIGLAIAKQLVEAGGGGVGAESQQGSTRFWFRIPLQAGTPRDRA